MIMPELKQLLIVIDLQAGWRHETATEGAMMNTVELCKKFDGDVVHCRFRNDPSSLFHTQLNWKRFVDDEDTAEIPEIAKLKIPTIWRTTYSCVNREIRPLLKKYDNVYIAGVFTDISVFTTAMEIFDMGIPVYVVADCVGTLHGEETHYYSLQSLSHGIGAGHLVGSAAVVDGIKR